MQSGIRTGEHFATRFSLIYAGISLVWILFSDRALALFFPVDAINDFQTFKGWGFVLLSALLIYYVLDRELRWRNQAENALRDINRQLDALVDQRSKELEQQTQMLRQSQQLYRLLLRNLPRISVLFYDQEMRYQIAEGQALIDLGYTQEQLIGRTLLEVLGEERIKRLEGPYKAALRGEETRFDLPVREQIYHVQFVPMRNETDEIEGGLVVSQDVTIDRKASEALARSQALQETLIRNFPGGEIQLFDEHLRFLIIGGKDLSFAGEKNVGKSLAEITEATLYAELQPHYEAALRGEEHHLEFELADRHYQLDALPARLRDGQIINGLALVRDITQAKVYENAILRLNQDLKRQSTQLSNVNKQLEAFTYSVSHDLRAPLRAMDGFSRVLIEKYGPQLPDDGQHYLQRIRHNALRMGDLIDSLLRLSRIGRQQIERKIVNLYEMCEQISQELDIKSAYPQTELTIAADLPVCYGDAVLLYQALSNLIQNALKFSQHKDQPRITIGHQTSADTVIYFVRDNGAGFDMAYVDKLFGVFQRLHNEQEYPGIGVGLAIVQNVINRHEGRIWAESREDQGACFYFTIPDEGTHEPL